MKSTIQQKLRKLSKINVLLSGFALLAILSFFTLRISNAQEEYFLTYLPNVYNGDQPETIYGLTFTNMTNEAKMGLVVEMGATWSRNHIAWDDIEPVEGQFQWSVLDSREQEWANAASNGLTQVVVVQHAPEWAQKYAGVPCGPIKQEEFGGFANFLSELVRQYSLAPYSVKYWEIWNEQDIALGTIDPNSGWGCWGDAGDAYFGGGYYAEMLKVVYPAIKAADPHAQVLVGGLLLDCDPRNPPPGANCGPSLFLEGMLRAGGADYFDGISYHAYDFYSGGVGGYLNGGWQSDQTNTGPVLIAKTRFIQEVLARYGVTGKYLMNTEAAILCDSCVNHANFELTKAYYVPQVYAAALAYGLRGNLWYTLNGWRNSNLIDSNLNPLQAYDTFKFLSNELGDANYLREIFDYPNIMGYEFGRKTRIIWLLWSNDKNEHQVNLPELPIAIFDAFGTAIPNANSILIGAKPVYIEFAP